MREKRARPRLLIVKGCHSEEEQAHPRGQRTEPGLPQGLLGDSEQAVYLYGCKQGQPLEGMQRETAWGKVTLEMWFPP